HHHAVLPGQHVHHTAPLAAVLTGDDLHLVVLPDVRRHVSVLPLTGPPAADRFDQGIRSRSAALRDVLLPWPRHITSGASEMIFMNRFSRSSRATGPKILVPRGLRLSGLIRTTALSSNLMYE